MAMTRKHETESRPSNPTFGQPSTPTGAPILVFFDPNRQAIRIANRTFLLSLNLREDGTGLARLSEVDSLGKASFLVCVFNQKPGQEWVFILDAYIGKGATPRAAATECLRKRQGLGSAHSN